MPNALEQRVRLLLVKNTDTSLIECHGGPSLRGDALECSSLDNGISNGRFGRSPKQSGHSTTHPINFLVTVFNLLHPICSMTTKLHQQLRQTSFSVFSKHWMSKREKTTTNRPIEQSTSLEHATEEKREAGKVLQNSMNPLGTLALKKIRTNSRSSFSIHWRGHKSFSLEE